MRNAARADAGLSRRFARGVDSPRDYEQHASTVQRFTTWLVAAVSSVGRLRLLRPFAAIFGVACVAACALRAGTVEEVVASARASRRTDQLDR